jgi:adenosylcobyric acid synthase
VILPGTNTTLADLNWLQSSGLAAALERYVKQGGRLIGICGGYQMLGYSLTDPDGVEAAAGTTAAGLGLLPLQTSFIGDKRTVQVQAVIQAAQGPFAALRGLTIRGYEIHMGRSEFTGPSASSLCRVEPEGHLDGLVAAEGRVWGGYLHGIFENDVLRHAWLHSLGWWGQGRRFDRRPAYERLADHVEAHLDMDRLNQIIWG